MNRRRFATAIRFRQEFAKRADRLLPPVRWREAGSVRRELHIESEGGSDSSLLGELLDRHREIASSGFPSLPARTASGPPDREALIIDATALLAGHWRVFDHALDIGDRAPQWRTHPVSGRQTAVEHFSAIHYAGAHLGGDVKYIWELNRHAELLRMAQAYFLTDDERFAARTLALVEDWIDDNPPNQGVNWISALEIAFRAIAWCWIWKLTAKSSAWTPQRFGKLLWAISHSARFVNAYDSIHHSPNTHLTGEGLGLLYVATTFPELRHTQHWKQRAVDILVSEIPHQFLNDGFHYERSTGYHRYNLEFYLHALAIARAYGEDWAEIAVPAISKALDATLALRKPDGDWPVFGDEDGGSAVRLATGSARDQAPLLALGATLLQDGRWLTNTDMSHRSLVWWFGLSLESQASAVLSKRTHWSLSDAGYHVATDTSSSQTLYCAVDAGPHGGKHTGHAHTDVGHVEVAVGDFPVIVDPGCAVYASDTPRRDWYRSLRAHASVVVDGQELAEPRGVFGWTSVAPTPAVEVRDEDEMWCCLLRYPIAGDLTHERQVVLVRGQGGGIFVIDRLLGSGSHSIRVHWPLGVRLDETSLRGSREVTIGPVTMSIYGEGLESTIRDSLRSTTYGSEEQVSAILVESIASRFPATIVTGFRRSDTEPAPFQITEDGTQLRMTFPSIDTVVLSRAGRVPARARASKDERSDNSPIPERV